MRAVSPITHAVRKQLRSAGSEHAATLSIPIEADDYGTKQTIAAMREIVADAQRSQWVHQVATTITAQAARDVGGSRASQQIASLNGLDLFIRDAIVFKPDTFMHEVLRTPDQLIQEIRTNGTTSCDCDDVAMFGASVARIMGCEAYFVTVAHGPSEPFAHVHYAAFVPDIAQIIPFDPQERIEPGTWTPAERRSLWRA